MHRFVLGRKSDPSRQRRASAPLSTSRSTSVWTTPRCYAQTSSQRVQRPPTRRQP